MDYHQALLLFVSFAAFLTSTHTRDVASTALQDELVVQDDPVTKIDYRLPSTMHPTAYRITLKISLSGNFMFQGEAKINVTVDKATKSIVLHCGKISIIEVSVIRKNEVLQLEQTNLDKETQKYQIDVKESLNVGDKIELSFKYEGRLGDNMIGLYKSSYINPDNTVKWLAITQFQTTHARHAFPCFDEPSFKAAFTIRLVRPKGYTAISNMPIDVVDTIEPGLYMVTFKQSVPMSTYLVAFALFDFEFVEEGSMMVWARPNARKLTQFALHVGYETLNKLGVFFEQDYELPKMDMIAVPDFSAGAMENWGMITYRESRLLYDEKESNVAAQQSIAAVIVHEITHMWFGNLLTPSWWSYLWLSEGFARYFQYFGTDLIYPSWKMEAQFLVEQHQAALAVDAIETSKSLTRTVTTPSDIGSIGDSITYSKGASIVRMMSHIVDTDKFYEALRVYIRNGKVKGIVEPQNLWTALQSINSTKINIEAVMNTWTRQSGYPVLSVKIEKGKVTLHQQRYLLRNLKSTPINVTWHIPITYATKKNAGFDSTDVKYWMTSEQDTIDVDISDSDWIVFNVQQTGFYRVNYDHDSWYRIINILNSDSFEKIHVYNRAGIVDDLLNLARVGLLDYEVALDGLRYLRQEKNYLPFKAAFRAFDYLTQRFSGDDANYILYKNYVLSLIEDIYEILGYEDRTDEDRLTVQLRRELNNLACKFGHKKCLINSLTYFRRWKRDHVYRIEPNQRSSAYCMGILYGDYDDWTHLWKYYKTSNLASEQSVVLEALGCSNNTDNLEQYLHYAISPFEANRIRKQDSQSVFSNVYSSSLTGANVVLDFVDNNHAKMANYYGGYDSVSSILSGASRYLSTQELVDKFERLIEKPEFSGILPSLKSSLAVAKFELTWYEEYKDDIITWIKTNTELPDNSETTAYRLPGNVIPKKYILALEPFLEPTFTFNGYVQIIANVEKKTKDIVLHASNLTIQAVKVLINGNTLNVTTSNNVKYDFLVIMLEKELDVKTEVTIGIKFTGVLSKDMRGFYRSSYINGNGKKRWLAATHLEPVGARKMFPCFDEPAMKAIFAVDVTIPEGYHAISNTKAIEVVNYPEKLQSWYRFEDTEIMSTYLLALVVSDFDFENETIAGKDYGVWARPGTLNETSYALSLMEPLVSTYEKLFKQSYTLNKLDMVALPDFVSGAMENWGLLTFKESNLLWHEEKSDTRAKQSVTNVISHEIVHQWFGNLVSPRWWNYVWLSEGFARYFQYFGTSHVKDNWDLESQFVVDQLQSAFESDALTSSHPMSREVYSPAEIRGIFDSISYAKAASVIRMIEKSFGSDIFYAALQQYLKERKFKVASPDDLYAALVDQINDKSVEDKIYKFFDSWTLQTGYPVVNVTLHYSRLLILSQERFLLRNKEEQSVKKIWHIPITWAVESNPNFENTKPKYWLTSDEEHVSLNNSEKWIIVNVQQAGFYRVNYDVENWERIIEILKSRQFEQISPINRAALIDDLMNLARAGYVNYDLLFSATEYLEHEQHHLPWRAFLNGLAYLDKKFEGRKIHDYIKEHTRKIMKPIIQKLILQSGNDNVNTPHASKLLRMQLYEWVCKYLIEMCPLDLDYIRPDEGPFGYCLMGMVPMRWPNLWDLYTSKSTIVSEKLNMLKGLGCSQNSKYLNKLLTAAITEDSEIRHQDSTRVFASVYGSSLTGVKFVMEFMKSNLGKMIDYYGDYSKIKTIMGGLAKRISTAELYMEYKKLSDTIVKSAITLRESLKSYEDLILYELAWYNRNMPTISYWLETRYRVQDYRLPTSLRPISYSLSISALNSNLAFEGSVKINIDVVKPTNKIVLNAHKLNILHINASETLDDSSNKVPKHFNILGHDIVPENQKLIIYLDSYIDVSKITVEIVYRGEINDRPQGIYRIKYQKMYKDRHYYIATYFLPNYARMAFPCFDEPQFKARFQLNIRRDRNVKSLSNMPLEKSVNGLSSILDIYKESPIMSTHLVAFIVSDFIPVRNEKETFNVWGVSSNVYQGNGAQFAAYKYYDALRTLVTSRVKALEKIDLVGLPSFPISAVENWGLGYFQGSVLFYKEDEIPLSQKFSSLATVARQVAHIYFGNLVSCEWWSYAWLDQGLAQYFQWLLLERGLGESFIRDHFVVDDMHDVMQLDMSRLTHSLNYSVSEPNSLRKLFDKISSKKAASLVRMFHHSFGGNAFYLGISDYVLDNQYKTVAPSNLWDALQKYVKNVSVKDIMNSWVNNVGYPLVSVSRNRSTGILKFSQSSLGDHSGYRTDFHIPISIVSQFDPDFENTLPDFWLTKAKDTFNTTLTDQWFIVNVQQSGYYRVNYDYFTWQTIIELLNSEDYALIHVTNRAQIIDDLFNLARAYKVSYENVFKAALYLRHEKEYLPWKAFERGINYLWEDMKVRDSDYRKILENYVLHLTSRHADRLSFDDEIDKSTWSGELRQNQLNRELILSLDCKFGNKTCIETAQDVFTSVSSYRFISRNAKPVVLCTAVKHGSWNTWDNLWEVYLETTLYSEQVIYLDALGCTEDDSSIRRYLDYIFDMQTFPDIRREDSPRAFASIYRSSEKGWNLCYEYMINNYMKIYDIYQDWDMVAKMFTEIVLRIPNSNMFNKFSFFMNNNKKGLAPIFTELNNALYIAKDKIEMARIQKYDIIDGLDKVLEKIHKEYYPNTSTSQTSNIFLVALLSVLPFFLVR